MAFERCFNMALTVIMFALVALAFDAAFQISAAAEARPGFFNVTAVLLLIPAIYGLGWFKSGLAVR